PGDRGRGAAARGRGPARARGPRPPDPRGERDGEPPLPRYPPRAPPVPGDAPRRSLPAGPPAFPDPSDPEGEEEMTSKRTTVKRRPAPRRPSASAAATVPVWLREHGVALVSSLRTRL